MGEKPIILSAWKWLTLGLVKVTPALAYLLGLVLPGSCSFKIKSIPAMLVSAYTAVWNKLFSLANDSYAE